MSQVYVVSNSMRAKDKEGNPKVWNSNYGPFDVWNVYFQGDDNKYQVNKKEGFAGYAKGQEVYGTATLGQYGGTFKQEQAPEGMQLSSGSQQRGGTATEAQAAQPQQSSNSNGTVEEKLDYIIGMLEANFQVQGTAGTQTSSDTIVEDIDDKPIDLSKIDY